MLLVLFFFFFFFNDTATTEIYTLSLHDALPISPRQQQQLPYLFEGMSGSTRRARAHCCAARPSTPRCSPSGASSATRARSKRSSSGAAARRPSRWRVSLSACRPRSSACSASGHATICSADVGHGASVFTGDFLALQHPASELAACLGHATAFPSSDYAGSAPPGAHSRRRAYPPPAQPPGRRATPDGSHCNDPGGGCGEVPGSRIWQTVMCRVQLSCRLPARFSGAGGRSPLEASIGGPDCRRPPHPHVYVAMHRSRWSEEEYGHQPRVR